jgi:hypothetical protein
MKTRPLIALVAIFIAAVLASFWLGSQRANSHTHPTVDQVSAAPTADNVWEYKTVECTNQRQQLSQWNREGWTVLSISGTVTQKDGTISRSAARLRRAKQ